MPQMKTTGLSMGNAAIFFSRSLIGRLTAPLIVPAANSFGSRTSISISAPGFDFQTASNEATVTEPFSFPGTRAAAGCAAAMVVAGAAEAEAGPPCSCSHSG